MTSEALSLAVRIRARYRAPGNEHELELAEAAAEIDRFAAASPFNHPWRSYVTWVEGVERVLREARQYVSDAQDDPETRDHASSLLGDIDMALNLTPTPPDEAAAASPWREIAAETRRYYALSSYEQGREARIDGKAIGSNPYPTGTQGDTRWIAGYRGEPDPLMPLPSPPASEGTK